MSKQTNIAAWLMQCPQLAQLFNISAEQIDGANIIFPIGSSLKRNINDSIDVSGNYEADIKPIPSVYEEYQINCYKSIYENHNEYNIMRLEEVESVIDWINEQDSLENFPDIGKTVVAVETYPFVPQIRAVDRDTGTICYYVTLRITYVNTAQRRYVGCQV